MGVAHPEATNARQLTTSAHRGNHRKIIFDLSNINDAMLAAEFTDVGKDSKDATVPMA
jgi:hypothetical protein